MKVAGFTIVRNAIKYDYPVVEAITSVLPLCDEFIVSVGDADDGTLELIESIPSDKIKIVRSVWDEQLRTGGRVMAQETDKAFAHVSPDADWVFYIQADELLHERYYDVVRGAMQRYLSQTAVEGLLFKYIHFYGSYDYVGESWSWYRREIRIIRNDRNIFSYRDAQGFRKRPNEKLRVKLIDAFIYHYGWVRDPRKFQEKRKAFERLYNDQINETPLEEPSIEFDYSKVDSLELFVGTHPQVMKERIRSRNWFFEHDVRRKKYSFKERLKRLIGFRVGEYRNYKLI